MSKNKPLEPQNHIRVSIKRRSRSVRVTKSFNDPSKTNVIKVSRFSSFSKQKVNPEDHITNAINNTRHITHSKLDSHNSIKQSVKENEVKPLETEILENKNSEITIRDRTESIRTKGVNISKISRQSSQEQTRNNSPTTTITTDTDTKINRKISITKNKSQHNIEHQSSICNSIKTHSINGIEPTLSIATNYQKSRLITNLDDEIYAWPRELESVSYREPNRFKKKKTTEKAERKRRRYLRCAWWPCSPCCTAILVFSVLLLLAALAALLIALLSKNQTTTTIVITSIITTVTSVTTSTTTSVTMSTTTSTTSTTTTVYNCGQSCLNQSWIDSSGGIAYWPYDSTYVDITSGYNAISSPDLPIFDTGYLNQAAVFNLSAKQAMYTSFIPLNNVSFTVEAWIKPTGYPNQSDYSIVGLCPSQTTNYCLHINIRNTKLYFGFFYNDVQGGTAIALNQWIHTGFVFDVSAMTQTIYLNGFQDGQTTVSSVLRVQSGNLTIGTNEGVKVPNNYYQGYIDDLSINRRPKSSCEILERATLAARFKFDTTAPYIDSGPNTVVTTSSGTSIITGYRDQAVSFTGSSSSYFQTSGFTSLGTTNQPFSISLWIKPQILSGTLVHLSTSSSGTGSTCFPLLGFSSSGSIIAQVLTSNSTIVTASGPILPVSSSSWIPIVQTWSSSNGLRLYVNNTLVSSVSASTFLGSEVTPNYVTLGNCLSGCGVCSNGLVGVAGPFSGAIDDWRIYSRELTTIDVCTLFFST